MHPGQGLKKDHTEPDALQGVQDSEPQPQAPGYKGTGGVATRPRKEEPKAWYTPPDLGPSGGTQATSEDWEDPTMAFREVSKKE